MPEPKTPPPANPISAPDPNPNPAPAVALAAPPNPTPAAQPAPAAGSEAAAAAPAPEAKPKGDPPAAAAPVAVTPTKYETKLPKDSLLQPADIARLEAASKEKGLTPEQHQQAVEQENQFFSDLITRQAQTQEIQNEAGMKEMLKRPEYAGDENKLKADIAIAQGVLEKYGSPRINAFLEKTRLGNDPDVIDLFIKIGKESAPATLPPAGGGTPPAGESKTAPDKLYDGNAVAKPRNR